VGGSAGCGADPGWLKARLAAIEPPPAVGGETEARDAASVAP